MLRRSAAANVALCAGSGRHPARASATPRIAELLALRRACRIWRRGRRGGCPAASSSGWRWPARWRAIRGAVSRRADREPRPAATKAIEDIVRAVAARGIKVVMATHDLGEARRLAGDIVFMHRGRVVETGAAEPISSIAANRGGRARSSPAIC